MNALLLAGCVTLAFGIAAFQILGEATVFVRANLAAGGLCLAAAAALRLRRPTPTLPAESREALVEGVLRSIGACWAWVLVVAFASVAPLHFDWTFEGEIRFAPATVEAVRAVPDLRITLYADREDPRIRRTRLRLAALARTSEASVLLRERDLATVTEEEDEFGLPSNGVLLESGDRFALVPRPTEGALFEGLSRLRERAHPPVVYWSTGAGEGDPERSDPDGFAGLASALRTEGYEVRSLASAFVDEVPEDAAALLLVAPRRPLRAEAVDSLRRYLQRGGRLIAFLEPGVETGLEALLAEFGLRSENALVVDPASGPIEGEARGLAPIAFAYAEHPSTRGLDRNRMTFFRRARSFTLHKPSREDRLVAAVFASARSWLAPPDADAGELAPPPDAARDYHPLLATGEYRREGRTSRIAAFGDSDVASNRYLRTLYNLDLVMNTIHWAVSREERLTLRPKSASLVQFPVPIQSSLQAFYGVGLAVPELVLLIGGWVWLRGRSR